MTMLVNPLNNGNYELIDEELINLYSQLDKDRLVRLSQEDYDEYLQKSNHLTTFDKDNKRFIYAEEVIDIKRIRKQLVNSIDNTAAKISAHWTRFDEEYKARESAAKDYIDSDCTIEPSIYITSFSRRVGLDDESAAQLILQQAQGLRDLLAKLADQRMRKYELKVNGLSIEQMQSIHDDIINKMQKLAEVQQ